MYEVISMKIMGSMVIHIYFVLSFFISSVVPTPRAVAASIWFAMPNMGHMVDMFPVNSR